MIGYRKKDRKSSYKKIRADSFAVFMLVLGVMISLYIVYVTLPLERILWPVRMQMFSIWTFLRTLRMS